MTKKHFLLYILFCLLLNATTIYRLSAQDTDTLPSLHKDDKVKKEYVIAGAEVTGINAFVNFFDRFILDADFAKISFESIKNNFSNGFVWDNDQFSTNLFFHPYHGSLYFNAARSNGMNFWESMPYSFFGSLMWETMGEIEPPAINDLIATTMGGWIIGEITYKLAQLILDDRSSGINRFSREFLATVICPMNGLTRILNGTAWKVKTQDYLYHNFSSTPVLFDASLGARYVSNGNEFFLGTWTPCLNLNLDYGNVYECSEQKPYDCFSARITLDLTENQPLISNVKLIGRLWGTPINTVSGINAQFGFFQHFNYYDSKSIVEGKTQVPYRISEAASLGIGLIYDFPEVGNLAYINQRIFLNAVFLGGSISDYYTVIDRDYNLGSGYAIHLTNSVGFTKYGTFNLQADYYNIFTWKGYENKDLTNTDPLFTNAQGDKGRASLFVINPTIELFINNTLSSTLSFSYYLRNSVYDYHKNITYSTLDFRLGLKLKIRS